MKGEIKILCFVSTPKVRILSCVESIPYERAFRSKSREMGSCQPHCDPLRIKLSFMGIDGPSHACDPSG